jgi:ATP-dependent Clp protease ATP-binding subunit ClpA
LIFFTSNLGVSRAAGVGFRPESIAYEAKARKAVVNHFSPEFINRLTGILPFKQITREGAKLILKKFYDEAAYRVASTKMVVFPEPTEAVYAEVLQAGYSEEYGVRELRRAWQRLVILPYVKGLQAPTEGSAIDRAVAKKRRSGLPA